MMNFVHKTQIIDYCFYVVVWQKKRSIRFDLLKVTYVECDTVHELYVYVFGFKMH